MKKYKCPCCGYYTFESKANGTCDICPVCYWEDDLVALKYPEEDVDGSNGVSLKQAQLNYKEFGACERSCVVYVRKPKKDELTGFD